MKAYLLTAAGVIFLSVIVSLLIPEGKLHKTVTFVMRLVCLLVLIQPVTGIFKIGDTETTSKYFDYEFVEDVYTDHQSRELEKLLQKEFGQKTECIVDVEYEDGQFKVEKVLVALERDGAKFINQIYAYLEKLNYINITVYAKST